MFIDALGRAGATIVNTVSHVFPHTGLTCVLILRESHAVLHTWPETGTINIDIFSCTPRLRSIEAIQELGRAFGAQAGIDSGDSPCRWTRPARRRPRVASRCG